MYLEQLKNYLVPSDEAAVKETGGFLIIATVKEHSFPASDNGLESAKLFLAARRAGSLWLQRKQSAEQAKTLAAAKEMESKRVKLEKPKKETKPKESAKTKEKPTLKELPKLDVKNQGNLF